MSREDIDRYLAGLDEPARATLQQLREDIVSIIPDAEEVISYGMPAFRRQGKVVAGFAAFKRHLSYLPHSGSVLEAVPEEVAGFTQTKGSLHFPLDKALSREVVRKLIAVRLSQLNPS